jgi:hypothetical protein
VQIGIGGWHVPREAVARERDTDDHHNVRCPTNLLRLARVPFVADLGGGELMRLLKVSVSDEIEVGTISPGYGGDDVVYHPVPASRVQHSQNLRFVYQTPDGIRAYTYAEIRDLPDLA